MPELKINLTEDQMARLGILPSSDEQACPYQGNSKIDSKLRFAPDDKAIAVTIVLHAKQWRQAIELMECRKKKGNRRCKSLSGLFWDLIENAYVGMKNALAKATSEPKAKAKKKDDKREKEEESETSELFTVQEVRR